MTDGVILDIDQLTADWFTSSKSLKAPVIHAGEERPSLFGARDGRDVDSIR